MLLPEKLLATNYCQIPYLEIDLSKNQVFAITAPNGSGKSNTLNAMRYALSGLASPGADKLSEDIRDGADKATVEMYFTLDNNETGHIKREILRASSSSTCELTIFGADNKIKEKITKSGGAEKRFLEILGVSPKHISEIIIAEQHSIDALLFWPAAERGPKFQRFLHGQLFQEVEKVVQKEKKRTFLDPHVEERRTSLLASLVDPENTRKAAQKEIARIEKNLSKPELASLLEKESKTKEFANLKAGLAKLKVQKEEQESEAISIVAQSQAFPKNINQEIGAIKKAIVTSEEEWKEFRPYNLAQIQLVPLREQQQQLQTKLEEQNREINKEQKNAERLPTLKSQKKQFQLAEEVERLTGLIKTSKEFIMLAEGGVVTHQAAIDKTKKALKKEATYNVIDQALAHMDEHKLSECIVCEGSVSEDRIEILKKQHAALKGELELLHKKLDKEVSEKTSLEQEIHSVRKEINVAEKNLEPLQQELKVFGGKVTVWTQQEENNVLELERYFTLLPSIKLQASSANSELTAIKAKITNLEKISAVKAPRCSEAELETQKAKLRVFEQQAMELGELQKKLDINKGQVLQLSKALQELEAEFRVKKLPDSKKTYELSDSEVKKIEEINADKTQLIVEREALAGATGSIKAITEQIAKADREIKGYEETKAYISDLEQLETWFRYNGVPSQILHRQLNSLCAKMEGIISQFQLKKSFKLVVDESLDVHMKYPSGILRPIRKASGGERIILGIAFRLATHHFLAPELPLLAIDEPSNHLFETNQVILQEIIRGLKTNLKEYGLRKFIYCTHSRALANEAEEVIDLSSL